MAARPAPMASALRALQRDLLRLGEDLGFQAEAVAMARALAVTTYRSDAEFSRRFAGSPERQGGCSRSPVEDYLRVQGERFSSDERRVGKECVSTCRYWWSPDH